MANKKMIKEYSLITFAAFITAIAVNMFFIHDGLAPGGITGMALVVSSITGIKVEVMSLMISIPLLLIATWKLGKSFGLKTLYITLMTPLFMKIVPQYWLLGGLVKVHPNLELILSGLVAGILVGTGIALALKSDCATGGTDVLAILIHRILKKTEVSNIILVLDGTIILASGIIKQNVWISFFSFISLLVIIKTIKTITNPKATVV